MAPRERSPDRTGFTLIELMVAMALMIIMTAIIIFIFAKSRDVTIAAEAQAQVFENARRGLDLLGKDLSMMIKTVDMEPFRDQMDNNTRLRNGHFDVTTDKTNWVDSGGGPNPGRAVYDYAPLIHQGDYEKPLGGDVITHAADTIFFKTITTNHGRPVEGYITYYLVDTDQERPILKRRFQYFDRQKQEMLPKPAREEDVCFFVTDFRIEFFWVDNRDSKAKPRGPGIWLTPESAFAAKIFDPNPDVGTFVFMYAYDSADTSEIDTGATGQGQVHLRQEEGFEITFTTASAFTFPQLVPGDKIFIYTAYPKRPAGQIPWVIDQDYTIGRFDRRDNRILFQGRPYIRANPKEPPQRTLRCNYRAAWLPSMFRITLRVKDRRGDVIRTLQRVFRVLGS